MLDSVRQKMRNKKVTPQWIIGIDEAGRGPIAGPVSVGGVLIPVTFDPAFFEGIKDSKQLSEKRREEWFRKMYDEPRIQVAVAMVGASYIDERGIVSAIQVAMKRVLRALRQDIPHDDIVVLLDGSLYAPSVFIHQTTIIKGDETEPAISLASIVAKVTRDRYMVRKAKQYPEYSFEVHKGYGTKAHYRALENYGLSEIHRASFITLTK